MAVASRQANTWSVIRERAHPDAKKYYYSALEICHAALK